MTHPTNCRKLRSTGGIIRRQEETLKREGPRVSKKRHSDRDRSTETGSCDDEVQAAAAAVQQARETLQRAEQDYERSCERVAERITRSTTVTIGNLWDGTLEFVRRHPAAGIVVSGVLGFLLGRSGRR